MFYLDDNNKKMIFKVYLVYNWALCVYVLSVCFDNNV